MSESTPFEVTVKGEAGEGRVPVSMSLVQAIYHEVTGKTEINAKDFHDPFFVELEDIQQLKYKLDQTLEQYDKYGSTFTISVRYIDNVERRFSSWEKFLENLDQGNTSATDSVSITLEFLIANPSVTNETSQKKAHRYKLNVKVFSKAGAFISTHGRRSYSRYRLEQEPTISAAIDYVDQMVAWTFIGVVTEWVDQLETINPQYENKFVRRYLYEVTSPIKRVLRLIGLLPGYYLLVYSGEDQTLNIESLGIWMLLAFALYVTISVVIDALSDLAIDNYYQTFDVSCLMLNRGDKKALGTVVKTNRSFLYKSAAYTFSIITTCILTSLSEPFVTWITNYLGY